MDITLALGGGGVKGFAHIGVLRILEQEGFTIRAIAGTSAGGMVGALYAAGYSPDELEDRLQKLDQNRLYDRRPGDGPSLLGLAGVVEALTVMLGERLFKNLRMPLVVTAVDLERGQPLLLREGVVLEAVLATIAVPGVFPPKELDGRLLVDGAVMNPVPVALARSLAPYLPVIAVVLSPPLSTWSPGQHMPRLFASVPLLNELAGRLRLGRLSIYSCALWTLVE